MYNIMYIYDINIHKRNTIKLPAVQVTLTNAFEVFSMFQPGALVIFRVERAELAALKASSWPTENPYF